MNITGGYVQCLVLRSAIDNQNKPCRDLQRHQWNITGQSATIDTGTQNKFDAIWSLTGNGWDDTRNWSMNVGIRTGLPRLNNARGSGFN
jgi:hypothetical protein